MKKISVSEIEYLAYQLAKKMLDYDEPIPDFSSRFPNILESCLSQPFQKFGRQDVYQGLVKKSAVLFYLLIKNHPFQNGNKRIAMTTLLVFLYKNQKWIKADNQELYNFAVWVAQSPSRLKDEVVLATEKFINLHIRVLK
jgi:death-on-curing family protein